MPVMPEVPGVVGVPGVSEVSEVPGVAGVSGVSGGAEVAGARETTRQVSPAPALIVSSPGVVSLEQRGRPIPGPGEVLIQPAAVGLCGTDLDILAGRIDPAYVRYPLVLGHEWSGTVLSSESGVLTPGTRVVAEGIVPCGHCTACRAGQTNLCATYDEVGFTRDGAAARIRPGRRDSGASAGRPGEHGRRSAGGAWPWSSTGGWPASRSSREAGPWWSGTAPWPCSRRCCSACGPRPRS